MTIRIILQVFEVDGEPCCFETVAAVHNVDNEQAAVDKLFSSIKSGKYKFLGENGILFPSCLGGAR